MLRVYQLNEKLERYLILYMHVKNNKYENNW